MKYQHIEAGELIERVNRFIARVRINGREETVHVKNTGRCRELLVADAKVYLAKSSNPERKTAYDLVAVEKGDLLINIDSQAPNQAVGEWLKEKELFPDLVSVRPETVYGNSRFDFMIETGQGKVFLEVKGVTLEENGQVSFPDAPSLRAIKHVEELTRAKEQGFAAWILFVVQMERADYFEPQWKIHPAFADALCRAAGKGVEIRAYTCKVRPDSMEIGSPIPVVLKDSFGKPFSSVKQSLRIGCLEDIPNLLLAWYDKNRRVLPWRENPRPYDVWVSEIMLQQTRVEAVKPYFERFMKALPDIPSLAAAQEEQLLKLWEGLGYYNRVRNMHRAAVRILEEDHGRMPDSYEKLLLLPGIGSYTAGAIASIAFHRPVPAVDGNVLRVVSRIRMDGRPITDTKVKTLIEEELRQVIPKDRPGDFNQAMMEIGACVCIPNGAPHCEECPLAVICLAKKKGCQADFPRKAVKKPRAVEEKTVLLIRDENRFALHKRMEKGLLSGLYEFPMLDGDVKEQEIVSFLSENGMKAIRIQPLGEAKHIFTHKEWHMKGYLIHTDELSEQIPVKDAAQWIFVTPKTIAESYPVPSAFKAYVGYLR